MLAALAACASDTASLDVADLPDTDLADSDLADSGLADSGPSDAPAELDPSDQHEPDGFLTVLTSLADLAALAASPPEVKYLARVAGRTPPLPLTEPCYFQDMHRYTWHLEFLRAFPELADLTPPGYAALVLDRATRTLWGGAVRFWPHVPHPHEPEPGVLAYTVYSESEPGSLAVADLAELDQTLALCIPWAAPRLAFVPTDVFQRQLVSAQHAALSAAGVAVVMPETLHDRGP